MARDTRHDGAFLHEFFKDLLVYFPRNLPRTSEDYHWAEVNGMWRPIKKNIDTYPQLHHSLKRDLETLFQWAQEFYSLVILDEPTEEESKKMGELWGRIRSLALSISCEAKSQKLFTEGEYSDGTILSNT